MRITGIIWLRSVVDKLAMKRDPIPKHFKSIEEAREFWDSHDLADYWDSTNGQRLSSYGVG